MPIIRRNHCIYATLVFATLYGWCLLCRPEATHTEWQIPVSHRYSDFSWWWAQGCPKHVQNENKYTKQNCTPSWIYLQDCLIFYHLSQSVIPELKTSGVIVDSVSHVRSSAMLLLTTVGNREVYRWDVPSNIIFISSFANIRESYWKLAMGRETHRTQFKVSKTDISILWKARSIFLNENKWGSSKL